MEKAWDVILCSILCCWCCARTTLRWLVALFTWSPNGDFDFLLKWAEEISWHNLKSRGILPCCGYHLSFSQADYPSHLLFAGSCYAQTCCRVCLWDSVCTPPNVKRCCVNAKAFVYVFHFIVAEFQIFLWEVCIVFLFWAIAESKFTFLNHFLLLISFQIIPIIFLLFLANGLQRVSYTDPWMSFLPNSRMTWRRPWTRWCAVNVKENTSLCSFIFC